MPRFSLIIPVYNRPEEVKELLDSVLQQSYSDFEVVIVEDGSTIRCEEVVEKYQSKLSILYYFKPNSGPGDTRNYGMRKALGDYFIFLDSDCILPKDYLRIIFNHLNTNYLDCFGGPDKADKSFSPIQKAINYSMTSIFTTGGIRGESKNAFEKFNPRSFNMGCSKDVINAVKGFSKMRFGEDIDFSLRVKDKGYKVGLIDKAFVYHKRRTSFSQFYKQVFNSGMARIRLNQLHSGSLKLVHLFPSAFTLYIITTLFLGIAFSFLWSIIPYLIFVLLIFTHSLIINKNLTVGILSIVSSTVQLVGYGCGFLFALYMAIFKKGNKSFMFNKNFYK